MILNIVADEESGTAVSEIDLAVIYDAGGRRRCIETPWAATGQVGHGDRRRRHQESMRGDGRLSSDVKSRGVLEHDITVGVELSQDLRGILIVDLIPDQRRRGRLNKRGRFGEAYIKTLPIDESAIGGLDRQMRTLVAERGAALSDAGTERVRLS